MYSVGDYVVKAYSGVCKVADILSMEDAGGVRSRRYYLLIPQDEKNAKLYVPVDGSQTMTRCVLSRDEAWKLISHIPEINMGWVENEKQREREYQEVLRSCDPELLAGMIKNIWMRQRKRREQGKRFMATDERYFRLAEHALYTELAFAIGCEADKIPQIIADVAVEKPECGKQEASYTRDSQN